MAKVNITNELAEKIKELRITNKIKAIDLADHIKKSPAYITKLENGDIKTLDYKELLTIFNFISKDEDDLGKIIDKLPLELNSEELKEQTWFLNLDTVVRKIPIPSDLIDYINMEIADLGVSISDLVDYINKNEDLSDIISENKIDIDNIENNLWYSYDNADNEISSFIIFKLSLNQVIEILEKKQDTSNYVTIKSILYNLLRLKYIQNNSFSEEENKKIKQLVTLTLNSYKFYSSIEKSRVLKNAVTQQEFDSLLNEFDIANKELVNEFLGYISFLSEFNVKYTNEKMSLVNRNFKWDASYLITLASLPFYQLENTSKSLKSSLLNDIKKLIEEYKSKPEAEKTIEVY